LSDASGEALRAKYKQPLERSNEHRIKEYVLRHYDSTTRPVHSDKTPVHVFVAISLYHILDTNEREQTFTCLLSVRQNWKDEYLAWNPSEYGNVSTIRVPANTIWTPDLVISNFAGDKFNDYMITNAIVQSTGHILWMFPALIKTYCTLNVKYFPFDTQNCEIVFISWTHSGYELDVDYSDNLTNVVYYKSENQEWMVDGITTERHVRKYACCVEPYPDVTFTINMRRGSLFYVVNLIAPCFLIFLISFLGFFLPVESGEKVNLETTILLALVVFLLMVGETMPPTPDAIPILGMFFASTMVMVTVALVMAVIVTNIYAKKECPEHCPAWCIRIISRFYPKHFLPERIVVPASDSTPTPQHFATGNNTANRKRKYGSGGTVGIATITTGVDRFPVASLLHDHVGKPPPEVHSMATTATAAKPEVGGGGRSKRRPLEIGDSFDYERSDAEWRLVAKFTDRVFFWIFLALSSCVHILLFMQMAPETRNAL
jgi:cation transporter family protein